MYIISEYMIIKSQSHPKSILNKFDLLGNDENALSKAFAFILGKEPIALFTFLQILGVPIKNTDKNFREISIEIEKWRVEGRVDIDIMFSSKFHIIVESKIKWNRVKEQKNQYLPTFDQKCPIKILCFITQEHDINRESIKGIKIINVSWFNIGELYNNKKFYENQLIQEFLHFTTKNYKMKELKEILIQDLSNKTEIERFKEYRIYRRDQTFGSPLYFAPYFTNQAKQEEGTGICYLAKILGILTLNPLEIDNYEEELFRFCEDRKIVKLWIKGVTILPRKGKLHTFYFLDEPLKIKRNLLKDGTIEKGRGKGWIAAKIPKNRCVTFKEFTNRLMA
jgi:hypothetical protein